MFFGGDGGRGGALAGPAKKSDSRRAAGPYFKPTPAGVGEKLIRGHGRGALRTCKRRKYDFSDYRDLRLELCGGVGDGSHYGASLSA